MDSIVFRGDLSTLQQRRFEQSTDRFVVSFPDSQISVRVYKQDLGYGWIVYRYIGYIPNPAHLPSNITYAPSSSLDLVVVAGIGTEWLEEFAKAIRPGHSKEVKE